MLALVTDDDELVPRLTAALRISATAIATLGLALTSLALSVASSIATATSTVTAFKESASLTQDSKSIKHTTSTAEASAAASALGSLVDTNGTAVEPEAQFVSCGHEVKSRCLRSLSVVH